MSTCLLVANALINKVKECELLQDGNFFTFSKEQFFRGKANFLLVRLRRKVLCNRYCSI